MEAAQASYYARSYVGKPMANGKPYDDRKLTIACWDYPLGTKLRVEHEGKSVVVTVTDRGPAKRLLRQGRKYDLSFAAFKALANPSKGIIHVTVTRIEQ